MPLGLLPFPLPPRHIFLCHADWKPGFLGWILFIEWKILYRHFFFSVKSFEISSFSRFQMTKDRSSAPIFLIAKESKFLCLTTRYFLFNIFCRMKKSNEWYQIQIKNEIFWILYKVKPRRNHDSYSFRSYTNAKLVTLKR